MIGNLTIEGGRVLLRDHEIGDFEAVHAWMSDGETMKYMDRGHTMTCEETFVRFAEFIASKQEKDRGWWPLALVLRDIGNVVGSIHLGYRHRDFGKGEGELGWFVRRDLWGQGFGTEGARLIVNYGFKELQMDRISASCISENTGSERIMQRIGMSKEAEYREEKLMLGKRVNRVHYAILRREWSESSNEK